jgi:UDP-N-acetylmuramoyl-tripeptide--D-alanyl-D-alanine ligase
MKRILTRYLPVYPRAVIYMLQKSEYDLLHFWSWYLRVRDWRAVMYRGQLVMTPAASLLLVSFTLLQISLYVYVIAAWLVIDRVSPSSEAVFYLYLLLWLYAAPLLGVVLFMLPLTLGKIFYQPYIWWRLRQTRAVLQAHPGRKIAVAGSYGKTSMKEMLRAAIGKGKLVAATTDNMNTLIAISRFARRLNGEEEVLIIEFGEYRPGDIRHFARLVGPEIAVITGVNEAHLANFRSLDITRENIFTLEQFVEPQNLYVNGESGLAAQRAGGANLYSRAGVGKLKVTDASSSLDGTSFKIGKGKKALSVDVPLLGLHNVGPLGAAVAVARELGLDDATISKGLGTLTPHPGRLEPQPRGGGVTVLNDTYNGNPDGVRVALEFFAELKAKRKLYVTPGLVEMGPRTREVHLEIGRQLAGAGIDAVYLMVNSATPFIADGLDEGHYKGELHWVDKPKEFYENLDLITKSGDIVLLQNDWTDNYS